MPKATRSIEEIAEVRERIMESALDILAKNGYENLSMGRLGSRMNMTAANLYNYFGNKDEVLIAIHKKTFEMLHGAIRAAVKGVETPLERIKALAYAFVEFGTNNVNIYDIMFNRPIRQYSDYIGTPQEALAFDEYNNSMKTLAYAVMIFRDYAETRPDLANIDPKLLTIRHLSALHGIISLHNSRILFEMDDNPADVLKAVIDDVIETLTGPYRAP
ncbi:MAG TPA: TetR/AcrR family transcriptional regulator, partial [Spirochaetota bacterium]|nr:TetR/AcrR family transcriptional regulator [Spirochaetota bacterium]